MGDIDELIGQSVTLRKVTETLDGHGHLETESTSDVNITTLIQPVSLKDKEILSIGEFQSGDMKGYFKYKYTVDEVDYTVEAGDIIIDWNNIQWRVLTIVGKQSWGETEVFRKCLLRRITTD